METIFFILIIVLGILAISDLIVGVSNDAVNFLNSAIGAKAAPFRIIMIVAALGVLFGATFSSGMMEVARKGIFHPENFYFYDIMVIFLAVMITDVVLLDVFNTYGMPTSTTVSIVFELLGAAVAVSAIKLMQGVNLDAAGNVLEMADYINSSKALAIIGGILLSVVVSFSVGAVVQWVSRVLFSFNYKKRFKYFGSIFGGIAITAITYFILVKGVKGASFASYEVTEGIALKDWIKENAFWIIVFSFAGWTVLLQIFTWLFKLNILKTIVLVGTFALAMAFAGNDLVNFIGVPIAGYNSFEAWMASGGAAPDSFFMSALGDKVPTPTVFLIIAGLVMVLTLFLSKKAKSVVKTSLSLARQGEGHERFGSSLFARSVVRFSVSMGKGIGMITPPAAKRFLDRQFDQSHFKNESAKEDAPAFDMLRASINLVVASILISIATANKLPLSTTYVTFMVAMGTSLADRAWGSDSAVYRITGVISVIGGWFFTALSAFTVCFIVAFLIWHGGLWAIAGFVLLAVFFMIRTHLLHKKREEEDTKTEKALHDVSNMKFDSIIKACAAQINVILSQVSENYTNSLEGVMNEDRKLLKNTLKEVNAVNAETKNLKNNIHKTIQRLNEELVPTGHYYVQVLDYLRETAHCLTYITKPALDHVDNNHKSLIGVQKDEINLIKGKVVSILEEIMLAIAERKFDRVPDLIKQQQSLLAEIEEVRKKQIKRIKADITGTKNSMLFLGIMHETKNMMLYAINLLKAQRDFVEAERVPRV